MVDAPTEAVEEKRLAGSISGGWLHKCETPWGIRRSLCSKWATAPQRRHLGGSGMQWLTEEAINGYLSS